MNLRSLILFFVLLLTDSTLLFAEVHLFAKKGEVRLERKDVENGPIKLSGEWEFYWSELINPEEFTLKNGAKSFGDVPKFWKYYPEGYEKKGYGTYRLLFCVDTAIQKEKTSLYLSNIQNSYIVWFNGKMVGKAGKVGVDFNTSVPFWIPKAIPLEVLLDTNEIVIQVSNFRHRNGGIQDPVLFGYSEEINTMWRKNLTSDLFLAGSCFILGFLFIGMFFFWKDDRAALYFGFFSISFGIRIIVTGARSLMYVFPDLNWNLTVRIEYISMFAMHFFLFHFIHCAFPKQTSRYYLNFLKIYTSIVILICLIPGDFFTYTTLVNNFVLLSTLLYSPYIFYKALKNRESGTVWAVLALFVFFFTTLPQILEYSNFFTADPILMSMSYIVFMLSMSLIFASRFGTAFRVLELLKNEAIHNNIAINKQKEELVKQNRLINDSINYAKRIQESLLPSEQTINHIFDNSFLFFQPQSAVSGDFYWYHTTCLKDEHYFAVADCTGHGVPGAFISLIAINSLDHIISLDDTLFPAEILNKLNTVIYDRLGEDDGGFMAKDGLDICLFKVNIVDREMVFAAAHHKLFVVKNNGSTVVYKGDNKNIGSLFNEGFHFTERRVQFEKGDQVFLFSDGIYDQKGGEKGKKLYLKRLTEFLKKNSHLPLNEQKDALSIFINHWMEDVAQMDDMLVFSLKF